MLIPTLLLCSLTSGLSSPKPITIWVPRGEFSGHSSGHIDEIHPAKARNRFQFWAHKGDFILVNIIPTSKGLATSATLVSPLGMQSGSHGGVIASGVLQENGRYHFRVELNHMAETTRVGDFRIELLRVPFYQMQSPLMPNNAIVPIKE